MLLHPEQGEGIADEDEEGETGRNEGRCSSSEEVQLRVNECDSGNENEHVEKSEDGLGSEMISKSESDLKSGNTVGNENDLFDHRKSYLEQSVRSSGDGWP